MKKFQDIRNNKSTFEQPPPVLLLKRTGIRVFPNGERVALYYSEQLNKVVTIPYSITAQDAGNTD